MLSIAIDTNHGLIYEGMRPYGRALWPAPVVSPATITFESEGPLQVASLSDSTASGCRFREDYFDPISRIRRGRFYFGTGTQPLQWFVEPHPSIASERVVDKHDLKKMLDTFEGQSVWHRFLRERQEQPLVLLGLDERFTLWTVVNIEVISTGEELVTLKARSSLGFLPVIDRNRIPEAFRARVQASLDAFANDVHRAAPVSVIDRARDAASQILIAHFGLEGAAARDLSELIRRLDEAQSTVAVAAAKIIARLHARAKPVEQEKRSLPPIREQDAQLATQCVGTLLRELRWADWA